MAATHHSLMSLAFHKSRLTQFDAGFPVNLLTAGSGFTRKASHLLCAISVSVVFVENTEIAQRNPEVT